MSNVSSEVPSQNQQRHAKAKCDWPSISSRKAGAEWGYNIRVSIWYNRCSGILGISGGFR